MIAELLWGKQDLIFYPPDPQIQYYWRFPRFLRRKCVVTPVEGPIEHVRRQAPATYSRLALTLARSDLVVPLSEFVAQNLRQETNLKGDLIIPVGVDTRFFLPVERRHAAGSRVLFVGRLTERKGASFVAEAARRLPAARFQIVGCPYTPEDEEFAARLYGQARSQRIDNVEFLGKVSQTSLRELMGRADILLHPSRIEGIPRVTLEAAATGLPCIVFDDYHTPSVVDGVTGFQVKTFEEMLERLRFLLANPDARLRMGVAAREHVKQFDWDIVALRWEQVLVSLSRQTASSRFGRERAGENS